MDRTAVPWMTVSRGGQWTVGGRGGVVCVIGPIHAEVRSNTISLGPFGAMLSLMSMLIIQKERTHQEM